MEKARKNFSAWGELLRPQSELRSNQSIDTDMTESLQDMKAVATVPSLYPVLVDLNVVPSILGLLNHDNTDISVGVVDLLQV